MTKPKAGNEEITAHPDMQKAAARNIKRAVPGGSFNKRAPDVGEGSSRYFPMVKCPAGYGSAFGIVCNLDYEPVGVGVMVAKHEAAEGVEIKGSSQLFIYQLDELEGEFVEAIATTFKAATERYEAAKAGA